MIPVWTECSGIIEAFGSLIEKCVFCKNGTRTWHENTNNPVCVKCASKHKVSDIPKDWGSSIRKSKRNGTHDREDSVRAN